MKIVTSHPVLGLGAHGFHDNMQSFADAGVLTPMAAQLGRGETHNQFFADLIYYGSSAASHYYPLCGAWRDLLVKRLNALTGPASRAALMGLTFVVSFWIFGLTVEMFDLKVTQSFYATVIAILAAAGNLCRQGWPRGARSSTLRKVTTALHEPIRRLYGDARTGYPFTHVTATGLTCAGPRGPRGRCNVADTTQRRRAGRLIFRHPAAQVAAHFVVA